jgi:hypothetical protein
LYDVFFDVSEQTKVPPQEEVVAALAKLPEPNLAVTHVILRMCREIAQHSDINRMDAQNLAIVIAPNLLWKEVVCQCSSGRQLAALQQHSNSNTDIVFWLRNHDRHRTC